MNLDLDDPLGDLLSDGSNDSFFGLEPVKKSVPKVEKRDEKPVGKKMEQLFGITEEPSKPKTSELKLFSNNEIASPVKNLPKRPTTASVPDIQRLKPSQGEDFRQFDTKSNDSITSDLGFDPKKPKKKGNILDELLGIGESSLTSSTGKSQLPTKPTQQSTKATVSRQTTSETASDNVNVETIRKSGRRQSAVVFSDPLGLFGPNEKEKEQIKKAQAKSARKSIAGSEWLFNDPTQEKTTNSLVKLKSSPAIQVTPNSVEKVDDEQEPASSNVTSLDSKNTATNPMKSQPQLMESLVSETTNTLNNLKQQEFQLMVATQMKTQENVLIEMKNKQQELLKQQEHQFNELLKKQISRQSELEEIIRNQQERINSHIQALIASHAQAPLLDSFAISAGVSKPSTETQAVNEINPLEKVELEGEVKRLEMEKLRLEDLLSNISDNHEKEIIMIEKSYKKRIQLMEENLESMEHRFKGEIAAIETFFADKIKSISDERESNLGSMKLHYEEMMQNIRKSKFMEFAIKEESSSYVDILKRASSHLETASGDIHSLHEVLQEKLIALERDKEIQLSSREKRLEEQQKLLERTRELSEAEREKLLDLVQTLELKLNAIEQKSEEEQWSLKEKLLSFDVERKTFEKEKDFLRNQIALEQQKLQELKQSQLNEYVKLLQEVESERLKLQEEKARMEVAKTLLKNSDDSGLSRAEIDASIKYAEEAARESERQRERLIEMQRLCEVKRQELLSQENSQRTKQSELENSISRTKLKEKQAEQFLKQTKKTEVMLMAKYQSLQKYAMELSERETKIAKERLEVNQEKLNLQSQRKKLFETRCSLCKIGEKANELKGLIQKDPKDFDGINNEQMNEESFNMASGNFETFYTQDSNLLPNVDLENVPNLVDMNDDFLDSDLLMLKFDIMNSNRNQPNYKDF